VPCAICGDQHVMVAVFVDGAEAGACSEAGHARILEGESGFVGWSACTPDCAEFGCDGCAGWTHADWPFPDVVDARAPERHGLTAEGAALVREFHDGIRRHRDARAADLHSRRN
jgi:hypothetical protein